MPNQWSGEQRDGIDDRGVPVAERTTATSPSLKGLLARDDRGVDTGVGRARLRPRSPYDRARSALRNDTPAISSNAGTPCIVRPTASRPLP